MSLSIRQSRIAGYDNANLSISASSSLSPALASAQSVEVFATTGVVQLWDDEGNLGVGVPIGGGVGFKSPHGWGIEALAETQKATRDFDSGVRFDSTVTAARGAHHQVFRERSARSRTPAPVLA